MRNLAIHVFNFLAYRKQHLHIFSLPKIPLVALRNKFICKSKIKG